MAQRARATVMETKGSDTVYVSQAQAVTSLIEQAVTASIAAVDGQAQESQTDGPHDQAATTTFSTG
jgi:hypothetical protein